MLLFSKGESIDLKIAELSDLLMLLDSRLDQLMAQAKTSLDADSCGIFDRSEYFIGVGFVAMQQYIADTMYKSKIKKNEALNLGTLTSLGSTHISVINSAANWWKHESEWDWYSESGISNKTYLTVCNIVDPINYPLSNILAFLVAEKRFCLSSIIPILEEWRDHFVATTQKHT
ncbi:hypothetical protein ERW51_18245 [Aliivibrio finisterrensis]|uniref:hypothetical protein n=1 Tax=Aliivibrio finisterrensis TaxID=511998 RepID=UPI00101FBC25|nr:hypothetical protein [Aliivibrio finisterrensis]RYU63764.1 hypothetical protein ERW54_18795 [Aliivibrio finisterrensis]RYU67060.1 hypothetical protein ERW51_18245 [Aliivibrio finisterrensis]RYU69717.1 hypothetical protein ERW48_18825 [Aliivibrio finisterrensis]